jgi:hypothetical protein
MERLRPRLISLLVTILIVMPLYASQTVFVSAHSQMTVKKETQIRYIKFTIDSSKGTGVYCPWTFINFGKSTDTLISDGFLPFGKMNGKVKITDTALYFFGSAEEHLPPKSDTVPEVTKRKMLEQIRKDFALDKVFKRYRTFDQDTIWVDVKSHDVFIKTK